MCIKKFIFNRLLVSLLLILFITSVPSSVICSELDSIIVEYGEASSSTNIDGNILYVGGIGEGNFTEIQDAVDNATEEDVVFVYDHSSPYFECIVVNKSITLIGESRESTVIDGSCAGNVISVSADGVIISGFTIQNCGNGWQYAAIKVLDSIQTTISENIIRNNQGQGIFLEGIGSSEITISDNLIENNSRGLYAVESSNNVISGNNIINNSDGVYLVDSSGNTVSANIIDNKWSGIHLERSFDNTISANIIKNNGDGVYLTHSSNNIISGNIIRDSEWFGIWLTNSSSNTFSRNTLSKNDDIGIYLRDSSNNEIIENAITDNDDGIYLAYSSQNIISKNNFRNYKLNAYFVTTKYSSHKNTWNRNYWNRGRSLPRIIPGKIKREHIHISCIAFDWRPLIRPFETQSTGEDIPQDLCNTDGDTLYVGGNGPGNYSSIQEALDVANTADTIYVYNGIYYENIILNEGVNLRGENIDSTIIDGSGYGDVISIFADEVTISGFTIQNGHFGILMQNVSNQIIVGNNISNNLHGVSLWYCNDVSINRNEFFVNQYSIRLYSSSSVAIHYNNFKSYKIHAFFIGTNRIHCRNSWYRNYWDGVRFLPYPITGKMMRENLSFHRINFDWCPLLKPYEIS